MLERAKVASLNKGWFSMKGLIRNGYRHNWILDNMPVASVVDGLQGSQAVEDGEAATAEGPSRVGIGVPVGYMKQKNFYLYNHVQFRIKYHAPAEGGYRIVGVYAEPFSVKHKWAPGFEWFGEGSSKADVKKNADARLSTCSVDRPMTQEAARRVGPRDYHLGENVVYTYDVIWEASEVAWASRWDVYLHSLYVESDEGEVEAIHWFAIGNAILIVVTLGTIILIVLVRSLRADLRRYNKEDEAALLEDAEALGIDETGWKNVHADVFRPPRCASLLCVLVASGVQLAFVGVSVFVFAYVGFLSPAQRGSVVLSFLAMYALLGGLAGFVSARLDRATAGTAWSRTTLGTACLVPGVCGLVWLGLDLALLEEGSTGAVPLDAVARLVAAFCFVTVPLVYVGAAVGYAKPAPEWPSKVSKVPRPVPAQPPILHPIAACLVCGSVPFGASFVELYFVMDSIWTDAYLHAFGFALAGFVLLILTAAEVAALVTYYTLCAEDHAWWWKAFAAPATSALYAFAYGVWYFYQAAPDASRLSTALYFSYTGLACCAIALVTGAAGFLASLAMTSKIFSAIKFD